MRLIFYELKKVLSKRTFIIIFVIMLLMNIFIVYKNATGDEYEYAVTYKDEYVDFLNEYTSLSYEDAKAKLESENLSFEIQNVIQRLTESFDEETSEMYSQQLENYRKTSPEEYKAAEMLNQNIEESNHRKMFVNLLNMQISHIDSYDSFVGEMHNRADEQAEAAVFSDKDSFSYKNLYKTADDYESLIGTELSICNKNPFLKTVQYRTVDVFLIAAAALACVYLFAFEKTQGLFVLVRSTKRGRLSTIASKLVSLLIIIFGSTVIFTLSSLITNIFCCGMFDPTVAVQSISEFRNCILPVTTGEFLCLSVLAKTAGIMMIATFFAMILVLSSRQSFSYVIAAIGVGAEFYLYQKIDESVAFNHLKFINVFYLMDSANSLGTYRNINMFGTPMMSLKIVSVVILAAIILFSLAACIGFCKLSQTVRSSRLGTLIEKFKRRFFKTNGTVSIFIGELYKYFIQSKMILPFILLIVFAVYSSIGTVRYSYENKWDGYYRTYMEYLQGDITDEKEQYLSDEGEYFNSLIEKQMNIQMDDTMTQEAKNTVSESIGKILETQKVAYDEVVEEYNHVLKMREQGIPAMLLDRHIYSGFVYSPTREWRYMLMLYSLIVLLMPTIFSVEYKHDMVNILRPNRYGKGRLCANKFIILFISTVACYAAVYVPYTIRFIRTYGTEMLGSPLSSIIEFEASGELTVMQAFIMSSAAYLLVGILISAITAVISVTVKDGMLSVLTAAIFVLIPTAVIGAFEKIRFGAMFETNPMNTMLLCIVIVLIGVTASVFYTAVRFANIRIVRCKK